MTTIKGEEEYKMIMDVLGTSGFWFMLSVVMATWFMPLDVRSKAWVQIFSAWYAMSVGYLVLIFSMPVVKETKWYKLVVR